jgi:hypothetical protein
VMSGITACIPARIDPRPAIRSGQLPRQLSELCPLVVFAGGMAGLADRHAQGSEVEHDLGNQRRTVLAVYSIEPLSVMPSQTS